jgi:DNA-binding transcriptional regulator/RsmH inhibitor MraZ
MDGETTIVGTGEYFEIWSADAWDKELTSVADPDTNARRFTEFDLSAG